MAGLRVAYMNIVNKYPLLSQCVQTGFLMGVGDLLAQTVVEKKSVQRIEWNRTMQFVSIGSFFVGPSVSVWYKIMNKYIGSVGKDVAIKKTVVDQALFAPCFLVLMLFVLGSLKGQTVDQTIADIKVQYPVILMANYKVWPFVQLINFYIMPLNMQVVFVQCVALFWNTYISWKTSSLTDASSKGE